MSKILGEPGSNSRIRKLPPERGKRHQEHLALYAMGCCCCCCLHTIAGAIGAIIGGLPTANQTSKNETDNKNAIDILKLYCAFLFSSIFVGSFFWVYMIFKTEHKISLIESMVLYFLMVFLTGPFWLVAACGLLAIYNAFRSDPGLRNLYWKNIGGITVGVFLGSIIGLILLFALLFVGSGY